MKHAFEGVTGGGSGMVVVAMVVWEGGILSANDGVRFHWVRDQTRRVHSSYHRLVRFIQVENIHK